MNRKTFFLSVVVSLVCFTFYFSRVSAEPFPPFKMLLSNGRSFSAADLPKGKAVVIIYFSPDCEHCQTLMTQLFKQIDKFNRVEIIMVTFKPLNEVVDFERSYSTSKYPNIVVGTEVPVFYFRMYFKLIKTPFTVVYDRQRKFIYSYRNETAVADLVNKVKILK